MEMTDLRQTPIKVEFQLQTQNRRLGQTSQDSIQRKQNKAVKARPLLCKMPGQGKWSKTQQTAYILFLQSNRKTMYEKQLRKTKKIFTRMSKYIKTRVAQQCRSHHQKMMEMHYSLDQIIRFYKNQVFPLKQIPIECKQVQKEAKTTEQSYYDESEEPEIPQFSFNITQKENTFRIQISKCTSCAN